ncbi:ABC transporter permease [Pseudonocardia acaciae]|uniref:ABC transporter permease n=1 Tax=Pseudonocardia acaciae TaxID=551276 RepID=UPI000490DBA4|nr:ABC transporter permease [Pseudonocardia acaciae]
MTDLGTQAPPAPVRVPVLARVPVTAGVGTFLVLVVVGFGLFIDGFATYSNATVILATASVIMIASLGQLLTVVAGGFDLSIGGVIPLSAVLYARLTADGRSAATALLAVIAVGALVGAVHLVLIGWARINALITTLATLSITGGVAFTVANGQTLPVPAGAGFLGDEAFDGIAVHVLLAAALVVAVHLVLRWTIFGRRVYMVGGNRDAARLAGVRVVAVEGGVYIVSAVLAAVAGVVTASQLLAATGSLGSEITLQSLAAVVLGGAALGGGRGSVAGAVIGVLLLGAVSDGLTIQRVPSFYQQIVSGAVLLLAVGFGKLQERARRAV